MLHKIQSFRTANPDEYLKVCSCGFQSMLGKEIHEHMDNAVRYGATVEWTVGKGMAGQSDVDRTPPKGASGVTKSEYVTADSVRLSALEKRVKALERQAVAQRPMGRLKEYTTPPGIATMQELQRNLQESLETVSAECTFCEGKPQKEVERLQAENAELKRQITFEKNFNQQFLSEIDRLKADAELGALVRQMPKGMALRQAHNPQGGWLPGWVVESPNGKIWEYRIEAVLKRALKVGQEDATP